MQKTLNIAVGTDHRGVALKNRLIELTNINGTQVSWRDLGAYTQERTDYPIYAKKLALEVQQKKVDLAIGLCGSGVGMSIALNRNSGIFAALVWNKTIARLAKEDDNVNVLVFPADFITFEETVECISAWIDSSFKGGRYLSRICMIEGQ